MVRIGWEKRVNELRQEAAFIRRHALIHSGKLQELEKQAECYKVQFLSSELEEKRNFLASSRGVTSIVKRNQALPAILKIAAVSIIAGIVTKDRCLSVSVGLGCIKGTLMRAGETDWAVCLEGQLAVVTQDNITPGKVWNKWDSVKSAMIELEQRAQNGTSLGNLDAIMAELRKSERLVAINAQIYYAVSKIDYIGGSGQGTTRNWLRIPEVISGTVNSKLSSPKDTPIKKEFLLE